MGIGVVAILAAVAFGVLALTPTSRVAGERLRGRLLTTTVALVVYPASLSDDQEVAASTLRQMACRTA